MSVFAKYIRYRLVRHFAVKRKIDMDQAYFKYNPEVAIDKLNISLRFQKAVDDKKNIDKQFNFIRNKNELVETTLNRIKNNIEKELKSKINKKNKKKQQQEEEQTQPEVSSEVSRVKKR
jgi:hypothetical protein